MRLTLMADDVQRVLGRLEEGFDNLIRRLDSQDAASRLVEEKRERDKQEAIRARTEREARDDAKHAENTIRLEAMDRKLTTTFGLSSVNDQWITRDGKPTVEWVKEIGEPRLGVLWTERTKAAEARTATRNRQLGATAVWGMIAALVGGLATVVGFIGLDGVAAVLARLARALGAS